MCTLSWAWRPARDGYDLLFNRDERKERGPERAPLEELLAGTRVVLPADGDHGGTWLAVNEHGLTVCLLNGYVASRGPAPQVPRSRGLLVRDLAHHGAASELGEALATLDLTPYPPCVVLAIAPGAPAHWFRWDGLELAANEDADDLRPIASSGYDQPAAQRARAARYAELRREHGGVDRALLERFQCDHDRGPSALTACMHREDAETRSQCRVAVDPETVELVHVPGPPCRTVPSPALTLARRGRATSA